MPALKSGLILTAVSVAVGVAFYVRQTRAPQPAAPAPATASTTPTSAAAAPTLVELGSDRCKSCKAMFPVLDELRAAHACRLKVRFIDVWDHPDEGKRFGVKTIPTQVLLGPDGKELRRHVGFWSADSIRGAFAQNGHPLARDTGACAP